MNPVTIINRLALVGVGVGCAAAVFHSVMPGQFISAGRQGTRRLGQLEKIQVPSNPDILNYEAFQLKHQVSSLTHSLVSPPLNHARLDTRSRARRSVL